MDEMELEGLIHRLEGGRWILAFWHHCAGEWYALPVDRDGPLSAGTLEGLAERGARTYMTHANAVRAYRRLVG